VAGRDERNRALGRAGEERVLARERSALRSVSSIVKRNTTGG